MFQQSTRLRKVLQPPFMRCISPVHLFQCQSRTSLLVVARAREVCNRNTSPAAPLPYSSALLGTLRGKLRYCEERLYSLLKGQASNQYKDITTKTEERQAQQNLVAHIPSPQTPAPVRDLAQKKLQISVNLQRPAGQQPPPGDSTVIHHQVAEEHATAGTGGAACPVVLHAQWCPKAALWVA